MYLIPYPKKIETENKLVSYNTILPFSSEADSRVKKAIEKLPCSENGATLIINIEKNGGEGYNLKLDVDKITLNAQSPAGAFYGIQTLRQIFKNDEIPCLYIEDKPDFEHRGVYHDITRGKVPTLKTLKSFIDKLAYFKINSLQLYVEHTFEFKEFADSIEKTGYLSASEIKELDDYCTENFIEFIPSIATFGHLYELLQKDEYKDLCVLENFEPSYHYWPNRMQHHTIDPLNPESIKLIKSLTDQYMPLFKTNIFNICCDETFDLKNYNKTDADTGRLYIDFVNQIIAHLENNGKKVMMWADILLENEKVINELPEDIYLLNWNYAANPPEDRIAKIASFGRKQIVCPGTSTWNRLCEGVTIEEKNISLMAEYGYKHGAMGVLNTNWGDYGNTCSLELAMYGIVLGAEKSWTVKTKTGDAFDKSINHLLYENNSAMSYLRELDRIHSKISWREFIHYYSNLIFEEKLNHADVPDEKTIHAVQKECEAFIGKLQKEKWINQEYRDEMLIAAEGILVIAELIAKSEKYSIERISDTNTWLNKYRQKWIQKNKESELSSIEDVFMYFERC